MPQGGGSAAEGKILSLSYYRHRGLGESIWGDCDGRAQCLRLSERFFIDYL